MEILDFSIKKRTANKPLAPAGEESVVINYGILVAKIQKNPKPPNKITKKFPINPINPITPINPIKKDADSSQAGVFPYTHNLTAAHIIILLDLKFKKLCMIEFKKIY